MSVTFFVSGEPVEPPGAGGHYLSLSNTQAREFLKWLGLSANELYGSMWAEDLAARIRRSQHPAVVGVGDEGKPLLEIPQEGGGTEIFAGRRPGVFAAWAARLLRIAEVAGNRDVAWS
jgi:hypothetical protein